MKKILSVLLTVIFLLQGVSVAAKTTTAGDFEKTLLTKIGVLQSKTDDGDTLNRLEFAKIITNILSYKGAVAAESNETYYVDVSYQDENADAINLVTSRGIMNGVGEGKFAPEQNLTASQAICAVVNMLGYHYTAELRGGYPSGYYAVASEIGVLKNVDVSKQEIEYGALKQLLANALLTEVMIITGVGSQIAYETVDGETLLKKATGLKIVEGVLRGTNSSSLTKEDACVPGEINIAHERIQTEQTNLGDLVGCHVYACVQEGDTAGEWELVYIEKSEDENRELVIRAKDIEEISGNRISYYREDSSRAGTARFSQEADVMWNGSPFSTWLEDDLYLEDGEIRLIDHNNDGIYDIVSLICYRTTVVKTIDKEDRNFTDSYNVENYLDLEDIPEENVTIYDVKMKKIKFNDISANDVVTWYTDRTNQFYTLIVAKENTIVGSVNGIFETDGIVVIDEIEYEIAPSYLAYYQKQKELGIDELPSGTIGLFYLDYMDRVAGFKMGVGDSDGWKYGYFIKSFYDIDSDRNMVRIFSEDNVMLIYPVSKKLKIDFERVREDAVENALGVISEGIVRFTVNANNEIDKIDTLAEDSNKNSLIELVPAGRYAYKGLGVNNLEGKVATDKNTKVFVIPLEGANANDYLVTTRSYFGTDKYYNLSAYGSAESIFAGAIVLKLSENVGSDKVFYGVISEAAPALDDDDMPGFRVVVRLDTDFAKETVYWTTEDVDTGKLKPGQAIQFSTDAHLLLSSKPFPSQSPYPIEQLL